ncbi:PaaI family thioesterase [Pseudofrankia sp. DC12]|uniref:hotdog fold thioesterase n=1 Tax=Pseudofrankia sp. DC12 TaxID=683315 RepID=UPI0005F7FC81|nr:PaaI family thioesterase [Pseudofrankia sp. DC12]
MTSTAGPVGEQPVRDAQAGGPGGVPMPRRPSSLSRRFRVELPAFVGDTVRATIHPGPWSCWPAGQSSAGAFGVALDNVLGVSTLRVRPPGHRTVTAEISLDVLAPERLYYGTLVAVGQILRLDATGGFARCDLVNGAETTVAAGIGRFQFAPLPVSRPGAPRPPAPPNGVPEPDMEPATGRDLAEILNAWVEPGDLRARVVVNDPSELGNPSGTIHGGVLFCVSELAASALVRPGGEQTRSVRMNFLRPGRVDTPLVVTAEVVHRGRTATVCRTAAAGPDGRPYAVATVTRLVPGGTVEASPPAQRGGGSEHLDGPTIREML